MSAYNTITFSGDCPVCQSFVTVHSHCHIASSFDGDTTGRFSNRVYSLGEKMAWWPESSSKSNDWVQGGNQNVSSNHIEECCYSQCTACSAEIFAVIRFEKISPICVTSVGLETDWPNGFKK